MSPFLCPKIFPSYLPPPSYLPHLIAHSFHLETLVKLPSLSSTKLCDARLEEGGKLNVEGTWRGEGKKSVSSQMQKQKKKGKLPPFFASFFFCVFSFFYLKRRRRHRLLLSYFLFLSTSPPLLPPSYLLPPPIFFYVTIATKKAMTTNCHCRFLYV